MNDWRMNLSRFFSGKNQQRMLAAILMAGVLLRVVITFFLPFLHMHRDSYEYYRQAEIMLMGRYLNYFPNGYPFIVLIAKTVTADHSQTLLLWLNIVMSTLNIWFVYDIGKRIFHSSAVALLAAFLIAIFPPLLNYVRWIMSETPTIFFLLGAYFFYYRRQFWLSGLFFGLATVVRTNIAPVFLLLVLVELLFLKKINYRLLLAAFLPIILVGSYCYLKTGKFSIQGNARINIMYSVTASGNHIDWFIGEKHPEIDTEDKATKMYLDHMKKEPGQFIRQRLANAWELWGFFASDADGFRSPAVRILLGGCNFFLIVFGLFGWWKNRKDFMISILVLPFVVVTAVCVILVTIPRYGYPAHPFLILLGAWTVVWLLKKKSGRVDPA
jgi:hypothetical protein